MVNTENKYQTYIKILEKELVPAMGCTEPIALAYCAAKAREILGSIPNKVKIETSRNLIKNVKSVVVPYTNGKKGIEIAVAMGIIAGKADSKLQVLSKVTREQTDRINSFLKNTKFEISTLESDNPLDMIVCVYSEDGGTASVRITKQHTNITAIEKNGKMIFEKDIGDIDNDERLDYTLLSMKDICDFALTVEIADIKSIIERQIIYNKAISQEGLKNDYGANIGSVLLDTYGNNIQNRAKAKAAAGSDARMNGCELPVIINSGSGNQGMTVSLPVIEYAEELRINENLLYRALILSNLVAIYLKTGIGTLSAYCGAVSAGAAAGAGIAFLQGGDCEAINQTIINALAIISGIVCDGAKASCAAKIATAVDAGILGYEMCKRGQKFYGGDGIISDGIEKTIRNIGLLGKEGMKETDKEIVCIMTCFD